MKLLFWILAILSIPIGLFVSVFCRVTLGLDLYCTIFGMIVCIVGMLAVVVSILCMVLGIIRLRKGNAKKAVALALVAIVFSGIMIAGIYVDDTVDTMRMDKDIAEHNVQLYGEDWAAVPAIEGIPELYQEVLNKFYAVVRDQWSAEQLLDLGAMTMTERYGDAPLDNIGFLLMDVNGDSVNELLIGTVNPVEEGGTEIFCMYSDPENPYINLQSIEGEVYYLHSGETSGAFIAEIGGENAAWLLAAEEGESIVGITYQEGAMDPAGRLTLEMIPFSSYK